MGYAASAPFGSHQMRMASEADRPRREPTSTRRMLGATRSAWNGAPTQDVALGARPATAIYASAVADGQPVAA
jgi:hypothetical protein